MVSTLTLKDQFSKNWYSFYCLDLRCQQCLGLYNYNCNLGPSYFIFRVSFDFDHNVLVFSLNFKFLFYLFYFHRILVSLCFIHIISFNFNLNHIPCHLSLSFKDSFIFCHSECVLIPFFLLILGFFFQFQSPQLCIRTLIIFKISFEVLSHLSLSFIVSSMFCHFDFDPCHFSFRFPLILVITITF